MDWLNDIIKKYPVWIFMGIGFILYFYSLFNGFVGDDFDQVVNNTFIHSITNLPFFFLGGTFNNGFVSLSGIYYKPLMTVIFSLLYTFFQSTPFFYHFTQLAFHIANSILLYYLFKKFFHERVAFSAALIFLIHPMNTEAVAYVSNLQDVLFTFFGISGLVFLIYKPQTIKNTLIVYLLLLLSLLSKETGVVFIALTLLYYLLFIEKTPAKEVLLNLVQDLRGSRIKFRMTNVLGHVLLAVIILCIYALLRINAVGLYKYQSENFPMMQLTLLERLGNLPQILFYYLKTFFFPLHLAFAQNWTVKQITVQNFYIPLIVIIIVSSLLILFGWKLRRNQTVVKVYYFFFSFLLLGLSLHLQILPLDMTVADRWFYVPAIGLIGLFALVWETVKIPQKWVPISQYALIGISLILFCLTFARSLNWQNQFTLYQHDVQYNTTSYNLLNGWASELMNVGKYDEAEPYIRKSIALEPNFCYSWNNLGSIYAIRKDYKKARVYYETALKRRPCALAYNNLATLMYYHFDTEEAYKYTTHSLKEVPGSPRLWLMLALIEHQRGNDNDALKAAERSYRLSPSDAAAYVFTNLKNHQPFELKEQ